MTMTEDQLTWTTSSYSVNGSECVEVARPSEAALVRDTKHRAGGYLAFGGKEWRAFLGALR